MDPVTYGFVVTWNGNLLGDRQVTFTVEVGRRTLATCSYIYPDRYMDSDEIDQWFEDRRLHALDFAIDLVSRR